MDADRARARKMPTVSERGKLEQERCPFGDSESLYERYPLT